MKADALDFLGDGSIILIGLFALAWAEHTHARVTLTQGCFLAALPEPQPGLRIRGVSHSVLVSSFAASKTYADALRLSRFSAEGIGQVSVADRNSSL